VVLSALHTAEDVQRVVALCEKFAAASRELGYKL